jgi:hypothetical protein
MTVHLLVETRYRWDIFRLYDIYHTFLKRVRVDDVLLRDEVLNGILTGLCVFSIFTRAGLCAERGMWGICDVGVTWMDYAT